MASDTIIEQAEHELRLLMLCKPSTVRSLIAEILHLRAAIEAAPHDKDCEVVRGPYRVGGMHKTHTCDCWKSKTLEEGK